jgi:hypothetical protein
MSVFLVGPKMEMGYFDENKPVTFSISNYAIFYSEFLLNKGPSNMW